MIFQNNIFASVLVFALLLLALSPARLAAQTPVLGQDVIVVLPFENNSALKEYNWIGASFADALSELLNVPGVRVVSTDERELTYQRLRLPLASVPSRATAIKIARETKASIVILGTYDVTAKPDDKALSELRGTVRVIRVNEGRHAGELTREGAWAWHPYDFGGALINMQNMQGTLAYQILAQRDNTLPFSRNQIVAQATKVPPRALESFAKGVMTDDREKRSNYLQNALKVYAKDNAGAVYPQAAFELGNLYFKQEDWKRAAEYYARLQKKDPHYNESAFYAALSYWKLGDLVSALGAIMPLTSDMPLTGIYNNAGALSTAAARVEQKPAERERLLKQAIALLERAKDTAPDDDAVRYNYAYALTLAGQHAAAEEQLRAARTLNPRAGEVLFLHAKSLERVGKTEAAADADNEARKYLPNYARLQTEWQKSQATTELPLRLNPNFDLLEALKVHTPQAEESGLNTQDLLVNARGLYDAGRDDEVLPELNRVLMIEPMNAEAHLLIGRIYQRRGDLVRAISSLKTAIFWDSKLLDAHVLLGRIFLERGDRSQAMTHARSAMQIDPNNQEALALHRQVETGAK
ncbi:MAG: tetratricopeptide repeat protein [Pyrinomonadaceae bacterium]|nr:tetratricopeptide repeat protein [Pyrinomonadaceae bacterium]